MDAAGGAEEAGGALVNVTEMMSFTSYNSIFYLVSNCTLACVPPKNLP